ncbi:rhodanese-like domain-containing protein [Spartinivicinus poritis]|uniref:Rhodanese-like domain-containing protein n=1 Tax=Spartinivicinus poritis TaxID=2994640 RepID=A0ABT5UGJ4_9GAMM|nr:rhodanese-like domain-containing protein [Spartinivicinus sp. A2-2]MDE1465330.1 rhodanese-like domain-containing protein [Spartinivicinus sp. A2-2]
MLNSTLQANLHAILVSIAVISVQSPLAEDFPFRKDFSDVKVMEIDTLFGSLKKCLVVDVRSKLEFSVIHINGAVHIPLSKSKFEEVVSEEKQKNKKSCVVFYCNGHTCKKSYKASRKTKSISNNFAYDAGIFDWATKYTNKTILLGKPLRNASDLISKNEYAKYEVSKEEALKNSASFNVIDTRTFFQRTEKKLPFKNVKRIPMQRIRPLLKRKIIEDKDLLFIDAVGKQNKWLQYYLKEYGYENYKFLKGGSASL